MVVFFVRAGVKARPQFYYLLYDIAAALPSTQKGDVTLGLLCITYLLAVSKLPVLLKHSSPRTKRILATLSLSKNAVVCVLSTIISYAMYASGKTPWKVVGYRHSSSSR